MWWVQEEGDGSECSVGKDLHSTAGGWVSGVMHSHYTKHVLAIVTIYKPHSTSVMEIEPCTYCIQFHNCARMYVYNYKPGGNVTVWLHKGNKPNIKLARSDSC